MRRQQQQQQYCICGHSEAQHYPLHLWMNGCKEESCSCLEWELKRSGEYETK